MSAVDLDALIAELRTPIRVEREEKPNHVLRRANASRIVAARALEALRRAPVSADAVPVKPGDGWQNGQAAKAMLFHYAQEVRPHAEALGLCREAVREAALASAGKVFDEAWPAGSQIGGA